MRNKKTNEKQETRKLVMRIEKGSLAPYRCLSPPASATVAGSMARKSKKAAVSFPASSLPSAPPPPHPITASASSPPPQPTASPPHGPSSPPPPLNLQIDLASARVAPPASAPSAPVLLAPRGSTLVSPLSLDAKEFRSPGTPSVQDPVLKESPLKLAWADIVTGNGQKMAKKGTPFLLESGEICVKIPNEVISKNRRNWDNFIIGQFHGKPPNPGTFHAIANGIWSNKMRDITISRLSAKAYLIRIPNAQTRKRVLSQGMWHIDNQSMFVAKWEPGFAPEMPLLTSVPVWLEFRNVPLQFFNQDGLEYVAGLIGEPKFLHPATANMTNIEVARVFTLVDPTVPLPEKINVQFDSGQFQAVMVSSPWLPPTCEFCAEVGHAIRNCPTAPITCPDCKSSGHSADHCTRSKKTFKKATPQQWKPVTSPRQLASSKLMSNSVSQKPSIEAESSAQQGVHCNSYSQAVTLTASANVSARKAPGIKIRTPPVPHMSKQPLGSSKGKGKDKEISVPGGYNSSEVAGSGYTSSMSSDSDWPSGDDDNPEDSEHFVPYISRKLMRQLENLRKKQSPRGSRPNHQ